MYQLRQAEALGQVKDSMAPHSLQIDPSIHDDVPLSSIIPPATTTTTIMTAADATAVAGGGGKEEEDDGYKIREYDMSKEYQIGEYRSIYD